MHIGLRYLVVITAAFGFATIGVILLVQAALHSRSLPVCWHCGTPEVRRSTSRLPADMALRFLFLVPYRCRGCLKRFYGFPSARAIRNPEAPAAP